MFILTKNSDRKREFSTSALKHFLNLCQHLNIFFDKIKRIQIQVPPSLAFFTTSKTKRKKGGVTHTIEILANAFLNLTASKNFGLDSLKRALFPLQQLFWKLAPQPPSGKNGGQPWQRGHWYLKQTWTKFKKQSSVKNQDVFKTLRRITIPLSLRPHPDLQVETTILSNENAKYLDI